MTEGLRQISNKTYCATCANFTDEDINGIGYCHFHNSDCECGNRACMFYLPKNEDDEN